MPRSSDRVHPTTTPIRVREIAKISMMVSSVEDFPLFGTTPICVSSYDASYDGMAMGWIGGIERDVRNSYCIDNIYLIGHD